MLAPVVMEGKLYLQGGVPSSHFEYVMWQRRALVRYHLMVVHTLPARG